jgi:hypothetical protein
LLPIKRNTAYLKDKKNDDLNMDSTIYKGQCMRQLFLLVIVLPVLFHLVIVLPVLFQLTASDYGFGIFKLFFY